MAESSTHNGNPQARREGTLERVIKERSQRMSPNLFLWAAGASVVGSLLIEIFGTKRGIFRLFSRSRAPLATFVGQWAPTLISLAVYHKLTKMSPDDEEGEGE